MNKIGYALVTLGFLGGALTTVVQERTVNWAYFVAALAVGTAGVVNIRLANRQHSQAQGHRDSNLQTIDGSLRRVVAGTRQLDAEKGTLDPYEVHARIDAELLDDLTAFVEARETISHVYGLQAYADVMSHFAAGERYLNRVWSASADGYIDEIREYLGRAAEQFEAALHLLEKLQQGPAAE